MNLSSQLLSTLAPLGRIRASINTGNPRSEEHTSGLQSPCNLVCRLLPEQKTDTSEAFDMVELPNLHCDIVSQVADQIERAGGLASSAHLPEPWVTFRRGPAPDAAQTRAR